MPFVRKDIYIIKVVFQPIRDVTLPYVYVVRRGVGTPDDIYSVLFHRGQVKVREWAPYFISNVVGTLVPLVLQSLGSFGHLTCLRLMWLRPAYPSLRHVSGPYPTLTSHPDDDLRAHYPYRWSGKL